MRTRLAPALLLAASCFQVERPECSDRSGPYVAFHVCMPPASAPITMPIAPRRLVAGDFDAEGVDNDFVVLLDLDRVQVYTTADGATKLRAELTAPGKIESIAATRYFDLGVHGDDLLGLIRGDGVLAGTVFGVHNGGDVFAKKEVEKFDAYMFWPPFAPCLAPNSLVAIEVPEYPVAAALAFACETKSGPDTVNNIDGALIYNPITYDMKAPDKPFPDHGRVGAALADVAEIHAATVAQLDGLGPPDVAFASRTGTGADESLVVLILKSMPDMSNAPSFETQVLPLQNGRVEAVQVADVDGDGDSDLLAIHPEAGRLTVVRQNRSEPLEFAEPTFLDAGSEIRDVVIGDFSGDGGVDIAVAQVVDDAGYNVISMFIRKPDLAVGTVDFARLKVAELKGEILDLELIDYDGDGRPDIAAVVKVGSTGEVHVFLNRSPGE